MNVGLELFFCEKKSALKISVIWGLGAYSGCHVCLLIDCENVIFFFFLSLGLPPDPSLTICLTCLIIRNVVKIMGGGQLTTNFLTWSNLREVELRWTE